VQFPLLDTTSPVIADQLASGKFFSPGDRDRHGRRILYLRLSRHDANRFSALDMILFFHFNIMNILTYDTSAQFNGVIIVNDMSGIARSVEIRSTCRSQ